MEAENWIVYAQTDDQNRITDINSSGFVPDGWGTRIDEGAGARFYHAQRDYLDGPLYTADGIPRFQLVDGRPVERTEEEIAVDRSRLQESYTPTAQEQLRADVDFIAAMTGVSL